MGLLFAITPFNFPLNLACHKIGPAIALGLPFILKPSEKTPLSSIVLGQAILEAGYPPELFSVLPALGSELAEVLSHDSIKIISFTGSEKIGWSLLKFAQAKKLVLELGGAAPLILTESANLEKALPRIVWGAFTNSGQSCISLQRVFVHKTHYSMVLSETHKLISKLNIGNPESELTEIGPLISEAEAYKLESWVAEAVALGANLICGGKARGKFFKPCLITNVPLDNKLHTEEAFGPVLVIESYETIEDLVEILNKSRFGLQAGVFTENRAEMDLIYTNLEYKTITINEVPTFRSDAMPYGGIKSSGQGVEGVAWTLREYCYEKLRLEKRVFT